MRIRAYLLAGAVPALFLLGLFLQWGTTARAQTRPGTPLWEYAVYFQSDVLALGEKSLHNNLDKLGSAGWELVSVSQGISDGRDQNAVRQTVYFFKRPKP
jgi:hypothetical protein